jgi:N utilization substance protein A
MNKELMYVIGQMANEKGIDTEVLFEAVESALLSASKKTMGLADNVRMELDRHTGVLRVFARKKVVQAVTDRKLEISLEEARRLNGEAQLDDELEMELPPQEFGRIAAQTAKQVILQRVRDAERDAVYSEFIDKEGKIIRGTVHRIEKRNVIVELGKAESVITEREQLPGERYNPGDRVRAYVLEVKKTAKGPQILLSRTHPGFLVRLFESEIPEIAEGIVQVKGAAREPGERAKVAVASSKRDVDPIGACVGLRGTRIQVISRELRGEKIDIVEWSPDSATFVARALSPAKVSSVTLSEPAGADESGNETEQPSVLVIVPDNQLSLAIGKKGQNARLAAKLTGFRVDIKSESEVEEERRREEEELVQGKAALAELPGVGAQLQEKLVEAGLFSPARIVRAGMEALEQVPGVGEKKAAAIIEAAETWLAEHPVAVASEEIGGVEAEAFVEDRGEDDGHASASESGGPPENAARAPAE